MNGIVKKWEIEYEQFLSISMKISVKLWFTLLIVYGVMQYLSSFGEDRESIFSYLKYFCQQHIEGIQEREENPST